MVLRGESPTRAPDIALGPLGDSVWRWSHVHRRWTELGLSIPTATTTVEGGFRSLRVGIFMQMTHTLSEANFNRYCRLVILALNYNLLHCWDMPDPRSTDKRI